MAKILSRLIAHTSSILFFACSPLVQAGGYAPLDTVVNRADLIVVGTISNASLSTPEFMVTLLIDRVIKGPEVRGMIAIRGPLPPLVRAQTTLTYKDSGLWFLRRTGADNSWTVVLLQSDAIIRGNSYWLPQTAVSTVSVNPAMPLVPQLVQLIADGIVAGNPDDEAAKRLISSVQFIQSAEIDEIFRRLLNSGTAKGRVLGAARLVSRKSPSAVLETDRLLKTQLGPYDRSALITALYDFRGTDSAAVNALGALATSNSDEYVRRAAAISLARIHTSQALPFLAMLLDSKETLIREEAISGFSLFAAGIPTADSDLELGKLVSEYLLPRRTSTQPIAPNSRFETSDTIRFFHQGGFNNAQREVEVIQFWKSWWSTNKEAIPTP